MQPGLPDARRLTMRLAAPLLAACSLVALSACGGKPVQPRLNPAAPPVTKTTVRQKASLPAVSKPPVGAALLTAAVRPEQKKKKRPRCGNDKCEREENPYCGGGAQRVCRNDRGKIIPCPPQQCPKPKFPCLRDCPPPL